MYISHFIIQGIKKMWTQSQDLIKVIFFTALSRPFLNETVLFVFHYKYVVVENIITIYESSFMLPGRKHFFRTLLDSILGSL